MSVRKQYEDIKKMDKHIKQKQFKEKMAQVKQRGFERHVQKQIHEAKPSVRTRAEVTYHAKKGAKSVIGGSSKAIGRGVQSAYFGKGKAVGNRKMPPIKKNKYWVGD